MSQSRNPILEETQYVVDTAAYVKINRKKIPALPIYDKQVPSWDNEIHFTNDAERTLGYVLVLDTLNFCFWNTPEKKWSVQFKEKKYSGYKALAASLTRAMGEDIPLDNAYYLRAMPKEDLEEILHGEGELLLMEERLKAVHEVGRILLEKHHGHILHMLEEAGFDAQSLAFIMARDFSSFRDVVQYKGRTIPLLKRAQILSADICGALKENLLHGMSKLTAFADYKLPQLLHAYGVLDYEQSLEERISTGVELMAGCEEETEIRAATIQAVEMIKKEFAKKHHVLSAYKIDWILWTTSKELSLPPHHRTRTIFY